MAAERCYGLFSPDFEIQSVAPENPSDENQSELSTVAVCVCITSHCKGVAGPPFRGRGGGGGVVHGRICVRWLVHVIHVHCVLNLGRNVLRAGVGGGGGVHSPHVPRASYASVLDEEVSVDRGVCGGCEILELQLPSRRSA